MKFFIAQLTVLSALLCACLVYSLMTGAHHYAFTIVWSSLFSFNDSYEHIIIQDVRLPRSLAAMMAGSVLAVCGAILQGITRNPLASPSILAVNSGAAFAVVLVMMFTGGVSMLVAPIYAAIGAVLAVLLVYLISHLGLGGSTPTKLTLSGAVVSAFLTALTTALLIFDYETLEKVRFWTAGTLSQTEISVVYSVLPYAVVGLILALSLGKSLNIYSLGEETASSLGQHTQRFKLLALIACVLCASSAVSLAGPVAFVGLLAPHLIRFLSKKEDYIKLLPLCAISGALLLLLADMVARTIIQPQEIPVGVCTAILGAPLFIVLARSKRVN